MEDSERFDIETVKYDEDGIPVLPRISFSVPKAYRKEFLQDMLDEVRNTPGEQLMAIVVKYYRIKRSEVQKLEPSGQHRIPVYAPKSSTSTIAQPKVQTSGAE